MGVGQGEALAVDSARGAEAASSAGHGTGHKMRANPFSLSRRMNRPTFDAISAVLVAKFKVDAEKIHPETTLEQIGLDSLALMEFVFAVEDRFDVRIPEDKLDPRQAGVTLLHLAQLLDEAIAAKPASDVAAA